MWIVVFPGQWGRRNKNIHYLYGNNIETFFMKYLQIFIFLQIKKPFVIH
jgi:hypothetical protein